MTMTRKNLSFLLLSSCLFIQGHPLSGESGERRHFLSEGPGPAAGALGKAFTALADDATAIYYNPAGLPLQRGTIYAEHTPVFGGGRYNFIGFHYPSRIGSFGFGLLQYATDDIETRRRVEDMPTSATASQTVFFIPFGMQWKVGTLGRMAGSVSVKRIESKLASRSDGGYGADVGLLYSKFINNIFGFTDPNLRLGLSLKNFIEPSITLISDRERLPRDYKAGVAISGRIFPRYQNSRNEMVHDKLTLTVDASRQSSRLPLSWGIEYAFHELIPLRFGMDKDVTVGLGYGTSDQATMPFKIDYSVMMTALAPQHRFSFSYFFTPSDPRPSVSKHLRQYKLVERDARRFRDHLVDQGKSFLRDRQYDKAITSFENALILEPLNKELNEHVVRAREATELSRVRATLDETKTKPLATNHKEITTKVIGLAKDVPGNKQVQESVSSLRESLIALSRDSAPKDRSNPNLQWGDPIIYFDEARSQGINLIHDEFHAAITREDLKEARLSVTRARALYPNCPVTSHVEEHLKQAESSLFNKYLDEAGRALSEQNFGKANAFYQKAEEIFPNNKDLKQQYRAFKEIYLSKAKFTPYDRLYHDQLYKAAALHLVRDEIREGLKGLKELLGKNLVHEEANFLRRFLIEKQIINQEDTNYAFNN